MACLRSSNPDWKWLRTFASLTPDRVTVIRNRWWDHLIGDHIGSILVAVVPMNSFKVWGCRGWYASTRDPHDQCQCSGVHWVSWYTSNGEHKGPTPYLLYTILDFDTTHCYDQLQGTALLDQWTGLWWMWTLNRSALAASSYTSTSHHANSLHPHILDRTS